MGVDPTAFIPKIEGFQPIPNAVMIPFMATQSAALAYAFGINYEMGKRTIKSMSNEKFNSLTPEDISNMSAHQTSIQIQSFAKELPQTLQAQELIFEKYVQIEKLKVVKNVELAQWIIEYAKTAVTGKSIATLDTATNASGQTYEEFIGKSFTPQPSPVATPQPSPTSRRNPNTIVRMTGTTTAIELTQQQWNIVSSERNWTSKNATSYNNTIIQLNNLIPINSKFTHYRIIHLKGSNTYMLQTI